MFSLFTFCHEIQALLSGDNGYKVSAFTERWMLDYVNIIISPNKLLKRLTMYKITNSRAIGYLRRNTPMRILKRTTIIYRHKNYHLQKHERHQTNDKPPIFDLCK